MADTAGSLVDKLATVNNKMFLNQEFLYKIRKMTHDEFMILYTNEILLEDLYYKLLKIVDLNLQRQALILELDILLVNLAVDASTSPEEARSKYIVDQHKTLKESV